MLYRNCFQLCSEYAIRYGLKLVGSHQVLTYRDDINTLGWSVRTVKVNGVSSVLAFMEFGLEINDDKTKYIVMSRYHNAGRIDRKKDDNISFEILF